MNAGGSELMCQKFYCVKETKELNVQKKNKSLACYKNKALPCKPNVNNGCKHAIQNQLFLRAYLHV